MGRIVLIAMRAWLVAAGALIGACYSPSIAPCYLACGANSTCPDNLVCNVQGKCASTGSEICSTSGVDGDVDAPPVPTTVTIDVIAPDGGAIANVLVVFATAGGDLIREVHTDSAGRVVEQVMTGSSATIIREGAKIEATTYLDLWPDATIVSQFTPITASYQVSLNWAQPSDVTLTYFYPYGSCFTNSSNTSGSSITVSISRRCPRTDLILIGTDNQNNPVRVASVSSVAPDSNITFAPSDWRPVGVMNANLTNRPEATIELEYSAYRTVSLAYSSAIARQMVGAEPIGGVYFPTELGSTVAMTSSTTISGANVAQLYVERLAAGTDNFTKDVSEQFPWIHSVQLDIASQMLTWSTIAPPSSTIVAPTISVVKLAFTRGGMPMAWHIIGRGDRITTGAAMSEYHLPTIPEHTNLLPRTTDVGLVKTVHYFRPTSGTDNDVRGYLESREDALDVFGIPGVTSIMRASAL